MEGYRSRRELAEADFVPAINAELRAPRVAAGATYIQIDEPAISGGHAPTSPSRDGRPVQPDRRGRPGQLALHICFGTYRKMAYAPRTYRPYFPVLREARAQEFVLEFANRLMAEIELWQEYGLEQDWAAASSTCATGTSSRRRTSPRSSAARWSTCPRSGWC